MPEVQVVRTHLEMRDPAALRASRVDAPGVRVERERACSVARYRELYRVVGERWHWRDRLAWSDARLAAYLADPAVEVWVLTVEGETAGYFEFERRAGETEIVYFGLVSGFHGRGLGGHLLTCAVEVAWRGGTTRVFLNTCTLDGPAALPNYRARGFTETRTETYVATMPDPAA